MDLSEAVHAPSKGTGNTATCDWACVKTRRVCSVGQRDGDRVHKWPICLGLRHDWDSGPFARKNKTHYYQFYSVLLQAQTQYYPLNVKMKRIQNLVIVYRQEWRPRREAAGQAECSGSKSSQTGYHSSTQSLSPGRVLCWMGFCLGHDGMGWGGTEQQFSCRINV